MNWDDPAERLALAERVGHEEYHRQLKQHLDASVVSRVGGHAIRPVNTRFGRLFHVGETDKAFGTQDEAEQYARDNAV